MGLESILVLAALLVAIYAVVPRDRRLSLVIKVSIFDWCIIAFSLLIIHYLQFYDFFRALNLTPKLGLSKWGITPQRSTYLVILSTVLILYFRLRFATISRGRIFKFRELTEELLRTEQHIVLIKLMESHIKSIVRIYKNDFFFPNLKERLNPPYEIILREALETEKGKVRKKKNFGKAFKFKRWISSQLPSYSTEMEAAHDIIRQLLLSRDFVASLVQKRPYFAIEILKHPFHERFDFLTICITALLSDTSSVLYYEIQNNQNLSSSHRYYIAQSNKLLYYLLADAKVAEKLSVWKPFGDYALSSLDSHARDPEKNQYNQDMGDFYEKSKWKCPLFITIQFFDIMVSEALHQNIQWHMWLYYFPIISEKVIRNYSPKGLLVNELSEWPTRYSYLLYQMISSMCSWVRAIRDIPSNQANVILKTQDTENENGNIPKSTILALCRCFRFILNSENISARFINYLLGSVFSLYFDIRILDNFQGYAVVLRKALVQGGEYYMDRKNRDNIDQIFEAFNSFDKIPYKHEHVREFKEFLSHNLALAADS